MRMRILLQAGMLLLGVAAGSAQSLPNGHIELRVSNESGAAVGNATVQIDPDSPESHGAQETDSNGRLVIELAAGLHEIRVSAPCFSETDIEFKVQAGEAASIQIPLTLESVRESCPVQEEDLDLIIPVQAVPPGDYKPVYIPNEPLPAIHLKAPKVKSHRFWHFWR